MKHIAEGKFGTLEVSLDSDDEAMIVIAKLGFIIMTAAALRPSRREEVVNYLISILEDWADNDEGKKTDKVNPAQMVEDLLNGLKKKKGGKNGKDS